MSAPKMRAPSAGVYTFALKGGEFVIEPGKSWTLLIVCFLLLAAFSAYAQQPAPVPEVEPEEQRGNLGVDFGVISDRFGATPSTTTGVGIVSGQGAIYQGNKKAQSPDIMVGGEIVLPTGSATHANEFAAFAGPIFHFTENFTAGVHIQVRKLDMPNGFLPTGQTFIRNNMLLLELPLVVNYKFLEDKKAFVEAQIAPEFSPHFSNGSSGPSPFPHPSLDHGYTIRGIVGYKFEKFYLRGTYETRYLKFSPGLGNPYFLWNWKTNYATIGAGFTF
jgi:hypothetical protein